MKNLLSGTAVLLFLTLATPQVEAAYNYSGAVYPDPPYNNFYIGYGGTGMMTLNTATTPNTITTLSSTHQVILGYGATDSGTVTIDGSGAVWTIGSNLFDGNSGRGTITISNGGAVMANGGTTYLGYASTSSSTLNVLSGGNFTGASEIETATATITIDGANSTLSAPTLLMNEEGGTGTLTVTNGGTLTVQVLYLSGDGNGTTTMVVNGGFVNASQGITLRGVNSGAQVIGGSQVTAGSFIVDSASSASTGSLLVSGTGTRLTASVIVGSGGNGILTLGDGATIIASSGITVGNQSTVGILQIGNGGATGILNTNEVIGNSTTAGIILFNHTDTNYYFTNNSASSGAAIVIANNLQVQVQSGTTTLNSNSNTYNGGTHVTGGKLLVDNSSGSGTGTGNVIVDSAGTLGGTGIIAPTGSNAVTVNGTLAPGNNGTIGKLTINSASSTASHILSLGSGAILQFDLGGALSSDNLTILNGSTADVLFNANLITLNDLTGGFLADGTYVLITGNDPNVFSGLTYDSNGNITSGLSLGNSIAGKTATLSLVGNSIDVTLTTVAVPEPSTWALLGIGLLSLPFLRRKHRAKAG